MAEPTDPTPADDTTPASPASPAATPSPESPESPVSPVEPEPLVEPAPVEAPAEPVVVADPVAGPAAEPVAEPAPSTDTAAPVVVPPPASAREVVYVQAPEPPAPRHNRGFGVLISLLGAVAFALLYLGAGCAIIALTPGANLDASLGSFLRSAAFWVPIGVYALVSILFALIVDRAAWWAHVLGSILVAILTYAVSLGVLALLSGVITLTPDEGVRLISALATNAFLLCALALARECALWFGLAIAARGRKVKERNVADREEFDRSAAERRAEYERAHPA
ncbi:hypothetical protein [Homoserinibacter sp. GY 40078]|uniref:hypothetical protein n=1 Tax=Homoserinibacter sp. GY 40078 TaxID=2603275 RepID=UPI0011C9323B|nr:hypothetical protein [Homoserinibacter sp. GY 40078]TXK19145.1 hypothetical protein FVQ89_04285 [Homoserinibacter sp. GY 40078]